ncbi:MAG: hypothetical protein GX153_01125 [Clostridiaceae bacterium]|nr:hypothetical protein [Clostridiaceae bacterium]
MIRTLLRVLRDKWLLWVAVVIAVLVAYFIFHNPYTGPAELPPPVQKNHAAPEVILYEGREGTVHIRLLADYKVTAAVKGKQTYSADTASQVSPMDLVLAWGIMNQPDVETHISYSQSGRWYQIRYGPDIPVNASYITENTANVHLIPASDQIASRMADIRVNDWVTLEGQLAQVVFQEGTWTSSLTRSDAGDGACEILYVTRIRSGD